jgi:outer membrane protein
MDRRVLILAGVAVAVVVAAGIAWGVGATGSVALGQPVVIGYVDMQQALNAHPRKAAAEEALNQFARAKLTEARRQAAGKSAAEQERIVREAQAQILRKQAELLAGLDRDIRAAVEKVARSAGVSIVLNKTVVLYGGTDLTDAVIRELKAKK